MYVKHTHQFFTNQHGCWPLYILCVILVVSNSYEKSGWCLEGNPPFVGSTPSRLYRLILNSQPSCIKGKTDMIMNSLEIPPRILPARPPVVRVNGYSSFGIVVVRLIHKAILLISLWWTNHKYLTHWRYVFESLLWQLNVVFFDPWTISFALDMMRFVDSLLWNLRALFCSIVATRKSSFLVSSKQGPLYWKTLIWWRCGR